MQKNAGLLDVKRAASTIETLRDKDNLSVQASWDAEIVSRKNELDSGNVKPVSLEDARRKLSALLR